MRSVLFCVAASAACLLTTGPCLSAPAGRHAIVPGQRIGSVRLGEDDRGLANLGKPTFGDAAMGHVWSLWQDKRDGHTLGVYTVRSDDGGDRMAVVQVFVDSPLFHTANGVHPGSTLAQVRRRFPGLERWHSPASEPDKGRYAVYDDTPAGVGFQIDQRTGRCVGILVHKAGSAMDEYYPVPDTVRWGTFVHD